MARKEGYENSDFDGVVPAGAGGVNLARTILLRYGFLCLRVGCVHAEHGVYAEVGFFPLYPGFAGRKKRRPKGRREDLPSFRPVKGPTV